MSTPVDKQDGTPVNSPVSTGQRWFFRRWVGWTLAGEAAGFTVAAVAGALTATQNLPQATQFVVLLAAGGIEGALLGGGQAIAMTRLQLPSTVLRRWPPVTSLAAVLAWSIGLLPSLIPGIRWSSPVTWLVFAALGLVLLASIPTAQFMLLRKAIPTAGRWIPINAAGWLLGISWTFAASPLVNPSTPTLTLIMIYAMAGVLMAATVAVVTGLCWMQWIKRGSVRMRADLN